MLTEPNTARAEMLTDANATEITIGNAYGERSFNNAPIQVDARLRDALTRRLADYLNQAAERRQELTALAREQLRLAAQHNIRALQGFWSERDSLRLLRCDLDDQPEIDWESSGSVHFRMMASLHDLEDPFETHARILRANALKWLGLQSGLLK